jgi:hypothetical protein
MMNSEIYLDANASSPVLPAAIQAAHGALLACFGNPSSSYAAGLRARALLDDARSRARRVLGAPGGRLLFTSGATEAIQTAVLSSCARCARAAVVCTMAANNETGVVSDPGGIAAVLEETGSQALWMVDCVQALLGSLAPAPCLVTGSGGDADAPAQQAPAASTDPIPCGLDGSALARFLDRHPDALLVDVREACEHAPGTPLRQVRDHPAAAFVNAQFLY